MIQPRRAAVRPRVFAKDGTAPLLLEEEVQEQLQRRCPVPIAILGDAGSGKTTALEHLKAIFGDALTCLDAPRLVDLDQAKGRALVYSIPFVDPGEERSKLLKTMSPHQVYRLAPWTRDDLIEYLLARHKESCRSVISRLQTANDADFLQGMPLLWTMVLDRMATLETEPTAKSALHGALRDLLPDRRAAGIVGWHCAAHFTRDPALMARCEKVLAKTDLPAEVGRVISRGPCRLLLAAAQMADELRRGTVGKCLRYHLPSSLVVEIADRLRSHEGIERFLAALVLTFPTYTGAMASSLWHQLDRQWLVKYLAAFETEPAVPAPTFLAEVVRRIKALLGPGDKPVLNLPKGYFPQADWPHADLNLAHLTGADLREARLFEANLSNAKLHVANFQGADLRKAKLTACQAMEANFQGADLSWVHAPQAVFKAATLSDAALQSAHLREADFQEAVLTRANFRSAHLEAVDLRHAKIDDTDFTDANFTSAKLDGLDFTVARLGSNHWQQASLTECNFEGIDLPGADFRWADLTGALLTDSNMPGACFHGATLCNAGLAGVEWNGADLSDADLTGASFHLGSSRSGLVGSPIACEGSRTGFYTDDYTEQDFKPAEEIRKANLRGADLRGARVDGVDFYLVDLRDALYDPEQADHFRRCGAILEDRCCE